MSPNRAVTRARNTALGLLTLPLLATSAVTGAAIWAALTDITPAAGLVALIVVHAYSGLVGLVLVILKVIAGITSWRRRSRRRTPTDLSSALLVAAIAALYSSGTYLHLNFQTGANSALKTVHLWSAIVSAPLVTQHLVRHFRVASSSARWNLAQASPDALLAARRRIVLLGGAGVATWFLTRLLDRAGGAAATIGPNDFPVTITAGGSDQPDPHTWRFVVDGDVERPQSFSLADLRSLGLERHQYPLNCVLGWSVVREWGGIPLAELLERCRPTGKPISAVFRSTTGYEAVLLAEQLGDRRSMVTLEVDGVALAAEHGYPARVLAPGVIGERCVKWVDRMMVVSA